MNTYDAKCYELAVFFLDHDEPHLADPDRLAELSQVIQDAIEDWIKTENDNYDGGETGNHIAGFAKNH